MHIWTMNPDENAEDPTRKETQEFDPSLIDEEGIHPSREPAGLEQEQGEKEAGEKSGQDGNWHPFETQ